MKHVFYNSLIIHCILKYKIEFLYVLILISFFTTISCLRKPNKKEIILKSIPNKNNVWVFIMAGQSNMAGRALIETQDKIIDQRILSINKNNELILARQPIHFYEGSRNGLDCGISFGKTLLKKIPDDVTILLIPTAVGASSLDQWLNDAKHENVQLLSNFREKVQLAKYYGNLKAILWHQGESEAMNKKVIDYNKNLQLLLKKFRKICDNSGLPIIIGELGSYSKNNQYWQLINKAIRKVSAKDSHIVSFSTSDLKDNGDKIHFNSQSQRVLGQRFANEYINLIQK